MTDLPYPPPYQDLPTFARHLNTTGAEIEEALKAGLFPKPLTIGEERLWKWGNVKHIAPQQPPKGFVYVIGFSHYVKIGYTTNINSRLTVIQTYVPEKIKIYGTIEHATIDDEAQLHERFVALRLEGEWFRKEGELAAWIEAGCPL